MTRPIVWASGILISAVLSATSASNQVAALFGLGASREKALSAAGVAEAFFWYVTAGAAIAFLVILTLPETKGQVLR